MFLGAADPIPMGRQLRGPVAAMERAVDDEEDDVSASLLGPYLAGKGTEFRGWNAAAYPNTDEAQRAAVNFIAASISLMYFRVLRNGDGKQRIDTGRRVVMASQQNTHLSGFLLSKEPGHNLISGSFLLDAVRKRTARNQHIRHRRHFLQP